MALKYIVHFHYKQNPLKASRAIFEMLLGHATAAPITLYETSHSPKLLTKLKIKFHI